jgi:hypothetical protein
MDALTLGPGGLTALLLTRGGYVVFTRRDIHKKHIKMLPKRGSLPVSFDYRLCPDTTLAEGPIADSVDALRWVRDTLSSLRRWVDRGIKIDGSKVRGRGLGRAAACKDDEMGSPT